MTARSDLKVRAIRHFDQPPDRVFDAFLDPARAGKFMFVTPTGRMVRVEIEPHVGGKYVFVEQRDGKDVEHTGEYLEIDRPRRLVFTFSVDKSPDFSRVTVDIVPMKSGCEVAVTHEIKPEWAAYKSRTEAGWKSILEGLATTLSRS